jgi:hypothetical protein
VASPSPDVEVIPALSGHDRLTDALTAVGVTHTVDDETIVVTAAQTTHFGEASKVAAAALRSVRPGPSSPSDAVA